VIDIVQICRHLYAWPSPPGIVVLQILTRNRTTVLGFGCLFWTDGVLVELTGLTEWMHSYLPSKAGLATFHPRRLPQLCEEVWQVWFSASVESLNGQLSSFPKDAPCGSAGSNHTKHLA